MTRDFKSYEAKRKSYCRSLGSNPVTPTSEENRMEKIPAVFCLYTPALEASEIYTQFAFDVEIFLYQFL